MVRYEREQNARGDGENVQPMHKHMHNNSATVQHLDIDLHCMYMHGM